MEAGSSALVRWYAIGSRPAPAGPAKPLMPVPAIATSADSTAPASNTFTHILGKNDDSQAGAFPALMNPTSPLIAAAGYAKFNYRYLGCTESAAQGEDDAGCYMSLQRVNAGRCVANHKPTSKHCVLATLDMLRCRQVL